MKRNVKYYSLNSELEVVQWLKNGDHPEDRTINGLNEGKIVGRVRVRQMLSTRACPLCGHAPFKHGLLKNPVDEQILVCPGDYIETIKEGSSIKYKLHKKEVFERYFTKDTKEVIK